MKESRLKSMLATMEAYSYKWRKTYQKIDHVITPSIFYKNKLEESNVFDCKITYIPNFLSDEDFVSRTVVGEYFLYFGRLSKEKGVLTAVQAYAKLHTQRMFYIVGTGPIEDDIKSLISELKLDGSVKLLGFKQGEELKQIVSNARCVILPSEWYENGPYSVMEALASGRPAIVSSNGGLPELVNEGETGFIAEPKNVDLLAHKMSIVDKLSDDELQCMSQKCTEMAKVKFDKEKYYHELMRIYRSLLKE